MGLIARSAYVEVDEPECLRARIIFSDGSQSEYFATRSKGYKVLTNAQGRGVITSDEAKAVEEQISALDMPLSDEELDQLCDMLTESEGLLTWAESLGLSEPQEQAPGETDKFGGVSGAWSYLLSAYIH